MSGIVYQPNIFEELRYLSRRAGVPEDYFRHQIIAAARRITQADLPNPVIASYTVPSDTCLIVTAINLCTIMPANDTQVGKIEIWTNLLNPYSPDFDASTNLGTVRLFADADEKFSATVDFAIFASHVLFVFKPNQLLVLQVSPNTPTTGTKLTYLVKFNAYQARPEVAHHFFNRETQIITLPQVFVAPITR